MISFGTDEKGIMGYLEMQFHAKYFPRLLEPVLPSSENGGSERKVNFWVYAPFRAKDDYANISMPTYDRYLFQSPDPSVEMTEEIFTQQTRVIFQPEVFSYPINGKTYLTYSQAVPISATTKQEIQFYLILLQEKDQVH